MREVRIRDTLSGEVQALDPADGAEIGIYACGPTVYSRIHIGNARPFVVNPRPSGPSWFAALANPSWRKYRPRWRSGLTSAASTVQYPSMRLPDA